MGTGLFWPFDQLEARAGKDLAKPGFFPFVGVIKAVKVKVPDAQVRQRVGLHHSIGRAFDAASHAQRLEQVAYKSRFARTEVTAQLQRGVAKRWLCGQVLGKGLRGGLIKPGQCFYNQGVESLIRQFNHQVDHAVNHQFAGQIQTWAHELGFSQIGIAGIDLTSAEAGLSAWLSAGFHGDMLYMAAHGLKRARPAELIPGTVSVITARMDYLPASTPAHWQAVEFSRLERPGEAVVSVYARGRDYHKVMRPRLQKLGERIAAHVQKLGHRAFTDSAPVLEAELAARSGQGWRGKHTLVLNREAGSMFFLGEIYVDLALPHSAPVSAHCGSCSACMDVCPTQAIVAPHQLDARRCISYLTIEHAGPIPLELRPLIGNRIYGCDDCQLVCPWNKFAQRSALPDFDERQGLTGQQLVTLLAWSETDFLKFTEGSAIRRIGHERWLRNIALAMGNALRAGHDNGIRQALLARQGHASEVVREQVGWALQAGTG